MFAYNGVGFNLISEKPPLDSTDIAALDVNDIWKIDRFAARQDVSFRDQAGRLSDIGMYISVAVPFGLAMDSNIRKDWADLTILFIETQAINSAVETGWKNIATIQEEILRICEAAHVPDIWATQVLETLAKKGTPSRAEITDAASSQRAECVMLNKGCHIKKAIKLLDRILRKMQGYQKKKETILSQLEKAKELSLVQDYS